ncbi:MAG: tRNA pseudouridine(55) synthase TruB [Proteobacteria bacterium]|nr:MAG: tRNA pseudouridine(55) synthase TruB [Pseudomonadota bacterium]
MSSNAALQCVRRLFERPKAGHAGTLDPFATGLLPICLGEATKFAGIPLAAHKTYEAVVTLGLATSTGDSTGAALFSGSVDGYIDRLPETLEGFRGEFDQVPPMFSALKHKGQPLYKYARAGAEVERAPRRVHIFQLDILSASKQDVTLLVRCSKGTYIRTLAHDIGVRLGCGGHLAALRRTRIGTLDVHDAVTLDSLASMNLSQRIKHVHPADLVLAELPWLGLDPLSASAVLQGRPVEGPSQGVSGMVRLYDDAGRFLGLAVRDAQGRVVPKRMCSRPLLGSRQII